jgi:hypothetical protein
MNPRTINLKLYKPHSAQLEFHNSNARYRIAAYGRQGGKSTACLNELISKAWNNPSTKYWYVSPTYDQAKIQYRRLVGMFSTCWNVLLKKNQTELRVKFINQSEIRFVSGEVFQNLRGETLNGCILDEVRELPPDLWTMVIRPMLTTTKGFACFVSTPNGYDAFYDLFEQAKLNVDGQWQHFHAPSTCNPLFTQEELEQAKREMGLAEFEQEILAEFRDIAAGKTYMNHGLYNQILFNPFCVGNKQVHPAYPIVVGMDFNVGSLAWTLGQQRGDDFYFFDEIWLENTHTQEAADELVERVKGHKPGVILCGDATGSARKTSASGETDYSIICQTLQKAGIPFRNITPDSNPSVKDRVNQVNAKLKSADGSTHLFYHPIKCKRLKKDFERVCWKPGASAILDQHRDPKLTHSSDSVGYPISELSTQWRPRVGGVCVIQRSF